MADVRGKAACEVYRSGTLSSADPRHLQGGKISRSGVIPSLLHLGVLYAYVCMYVLFVHADASKLDVVFVENATTGNNAVIRSVVKTLTPGDSILMTSFAYGRNHSASFACGDAIVSSGTVKKLLRQIEKDEGIRVDEVKIEFPITSNDQVSVRILNQASI